MKLIHCRLYVLQHPTLVHTMNNPIRGCFMFACQGSLTRTSVFQMILASDFTDLPVGGVLSVPHRCKPVSSSPNLRGLFPIREGPFFDRFQVGGSKKGSKPKCPVPLPFSDDTVHWTDTGNKWEWWWQRTLEEGSFIKFLLFIFPPLLTEPSLFPVWIQGVRLSTQEALSSFLSYPTG